MSAAALTVRDLGDLPVATLKGVGERRAKALAEVGVESVLDLLLHYPRRYLDRTKQERIADLELGGSAMVLAKVRRVSARRTRQGRSLVGIEVADDSGRLRCTFFNQPWRERQLPVGTEAIVFGKVDEYRGVRQMANPVVDLIGDRTGRIVPVYPQSEKAGLTTWELGRWVEEALRRGAPRGFADPVPEWIRERHQLVDRGLALRWIHAPESMEQVGAARKRLVVDELLRIQVALVRRKRTIERTARGVTHVVGGALLEQFQEHLPFPLTGAQRRAVAEVAADLARPAPMHRLLQGDVGSGKTLVAVSALLMAVQGGWQGALMAPTEVLAEQHHVGIRALLEGLEVPDPATLLGARPLRVELLTNRTTASERGRLATDLAAGGVDIVVGTHALIQEGVGFSRLGLAVIDEQHRFGVEQRAALREHGGSGAVPDVLVMTATPIPRTAAMTVYGDLDVSVLDELPPGRTPVVTTWLREPSDPAGGVPGAEAWAAVRDEVAAGRQAYVVCPLIEGSERTEARSAEATFEELAGGELHGLRLGLLHGRLPASEREATMAALRDGKLDVLVATTVIEVGVDVPNATIMVILDADRFGIAQLHQLRGRVGRGASRSRCFLVGEGSTPEGEARLEALVRTTDGFELAEVDLELRGEGTILGARQKGRSDLRLASLRRDRDWVERCRQAAFELVDGDPDLVDHPLLADELDVLLGADETDDPTAWLLRS